MARRDGRGILFPARLPTFHRMPAPSAVADRVRWFWIPRWNLAPGETSRQEILPFPAVNLVVQPDGVSAVGPSTRVSHRELNGSGWAVGALLRPAGAAHLDLDLRGVADREISYAAPALHEAVVRAMSHHDDERGRCAAVRVFTAWVLEHLAPADPSGLRANALENRIACDRTITCVDQVAQAMDTSVRGVQRLARSHFGVPPLAIIRRYRLQEAAERLRTDPAVTIARVAADLGYADHAHLCADFRSVLGFSPAEYRRDAQLGGR